MSIVDSTRLGDITAEFDGSRLTLVTNEVGQPLSMPVSDVRDLIQFVGNFNPSELQRRQSFRVPIYDPEQLKVNVLRSDVWIDATPVNISLNGILIRFGRRSDEPALQESLTVELATGSHQVRLEGEVRSVRDRYFGIFFPASTRQGQLDPPRPLVEIVMRLQRLWLARRAAR